MWAGTASLFMASGWFVWVVKYDKIDQFGFYSIKPIINGEKTSYIPSPLVINHCNYYGLFNPDITVRDAFHLGLTEINSLWDIYFLFSYSFLRLPPAGCWAVMPTVLPFLEKLFLPPGQPVTDHPASDLNPIWSPDGTKIAFMSSRDFPESFGAFIYIAIMKRTLQDWRKLEMRDNHYGIRMIKIFFTGLTINFII